MGFISVALDIDDVEFSPDVNEAIFKGADDTMTVKEMFERIATLQKSYEPPKKDIS